MSKEEVAESILDPLKAAQYLRDEILRLFRDKSGTDWKKMTAGQQEDVAHRLESMAKTTVWHVCQAIAGAGREVVKATLGPLAVNKDGEFVSKITFCDDLDDEDKLAIVNRINRGIHVVLMDEAEYQQYTDKIAIEPDEPMLPGTDQPQPDWPAVAAALEPADNGPEVIDHINDEATAQHGFTPAEPLEDDRGEIPEGLRREPAAEEADTPDAAEVVDDENVGKPDDDLIDEEPMDEAVVVSKVNLPDPTAARPTGPRPRARK